MKAPPRLRWRWLRHSARAGSAWPKGVAHSMVASLVGTQGGSHGGVGVLSASTCKASPTRCTNGACAVASAGGAAGVPSFVVGSVACTTEATGASCAAGLAAAEPGCTKACTPEAAKSNASTTGSARVNWACVIAARRTTGGASVDGAACCAST